jgi:threonine aldolase
MSDRAIIDLRSDTVTVPSEGMRRAMAEAEVGDDVYGEDPTVRRLEQIAAERTGKDAAVYVPSGSMSNLCAVLAQCERGDEVILGSESHILHHEMNSAAAIGGVQLRQVPNDAAGRIDPDDVRRVVRKAAAASPRTSLLCLENTHNRCSGGYLDAEDTRALAGVAHEHGLRVHIDGARIFNAALAARTTVAELAAPADTVGFCLSKGLGAPVGSVLCGDEETIFRARRARKMLGGGMRQAGVIAAAGVYALEHMVDRLADDHANAKALARGLAGLPTVTLDPASIETNIVIFDVAGDWRGFVASLKDAGVLASVMGPGRVRMVTHYGIERADIDDALDRARHAASALA